MSQQTQNQDFQPLPEYSQTSISNKTYTNVTTTRTDPDGNRTQSSFLMKRK